MLESLSFTFEKIINELKNAGYKLTPQRALTIQILVEKHSDLLTAEEIFTIVNKKNSAIGLATVYRTLDILEKINLVKKVAFLDNLTRYDLVRTETQVQPYYLVCSNCYEIQEINEEILDEMKESIEEKYSFQVKTRDLTFHGLCINCQLKDSEVYE